MVIAYPPVDAPEHASFTYTPLSDFTEALYTPDSRARKRAQLGLSDAAVLNCLRVTQDTRLTLNADLDWYTAVAPTIVTTDSIDTYKDWIGRDATAQKSYRWPLPEQPWSGRRISQVSELTPGELADVEMAGRAYLFGDSQLVASYREVLECCHAPFKAAVYAVKQVVLEPRSTLVVSGLPALLLFDEIVMAPESQLIVYTVCHAIFGCLQKQNH